VYVPGIAILAYFIKQRYQELVPQRAGRTDEARHIFRDMTEEARHLSPRERRSNRAWILKAKEELNKPIYSSFV
jgi:hypothetical protein